MQAEMIKKLFETGEIAVHETDETIQVGDLALITPKR